MPIVVAAALVGLALLGVLAANAVVLVGGRPRDGVENRAARGDAAAGMRAGRDAAALVLGARVWADGTPSAVLDDRLRVAAELLRDGAVGVVIASGGPDEVGPMAARLRALGVPAEALREDAGGVDTWSSVRRTRESLGRGAAVVVVTQRFHLPRALWLARRAGLRADGADADLRDYGPKGRKAHAREWLARVKAVGDVAVRR